jgi:hypothetical protein
MIWYGAGAIRTPLANRPTLEQRTISAPGSAFQPDGTSEWLKRVKSAWNL